MVSLALVSKVTHLKEPCLVTWKGQVFMSDRHEFEQTLGDSRGQKRLMCYSLWDLTESDMT